MVHPLTTLDTAWRFTTALLVLLVAGCVGDSGGSATVDYSGASTGSHADATRCDADGSITGSGNISDGVVHVSVRDASDKELYAQDFKGDFTLAEAKLSGASGTWTISADRSSDALVGGSFNGHYTFHVAC
jgi:hypothetical protein